MEDAAKEVQKQYGDIPLWSTNIDAQTMWLTKNPEDYGVIVASNLFGDVISDAFGRTGRRARLRSSGNLGEEVAVFEPTHGSAPKYAELDPPIVNPIAMVLSAAMMLEHVGENAQAEQIRAAIAAVVAKARCVVTICCASRRPAVAGPRSGLDDADDRRHPGTTWLACGGGCRVV